MIKILMGTANSDKVIEIKHILAPLTNVCLVGLADLVTEGKLDEIPDIIEDKDTIQGNAEKKATELAKITGLPTLSDDTGLFVDALDGAPGVYSARYAGKSCSYADNRHKMLHEMQNKTNRSAAFKTVVAFALPDRLYAFAEGKVEGEIITKELGTKGFGYDAIFKVNETGLTFAQMSDNEKNKISHRAVAFNNILPIIKKYINEQEA